MTRIVVVGNGMAGSRLVQELRSRDPRHRLAVTVFGAEPHPAYNRVLLSGVLAGTVSTDAIRLASPSWQDDLGISLHTGVAVTGIDRHARTVLTGDGGRTPYDALVLATGSRPVVPAIAGLRRPDGGLLDGAAVFRTLEDCERIGRLAGTARPAVVLGGGLLGLEAARGLAGRGLEVEVLHRAPHLMERQLDAGASAVLARTLLGLGVRVRVGARATGVRGEDRVSAVTLDTGEVVPADLLVVACGVEPETTLARAAGLEVDRGVLVDDRLRTSDPRIYALGECAQHAGHVYGLVAPAWEQAAVLADGITGARPGSRYTGSRLVTRLKAAGVDLAAIGNASGEADESHLGGDEVVQFVDATRGTYKKVVIRDGRLVGAILLGDVATVGTVTQLYDRGSDVPADRLALLFAAARGSDAGAEHPARIPDRATVCRCNGVTKGAITACWLDGASSVEAVASSTRATTGCGTCRDAVEGLLDWLSDSDPLGASQPRSTPRSTPRSNCA